MKRTAKKRKPCKELDADQKERLARIIIQQTERNVHRGVNRMERMTAPSGGVTLF